MIDELRALGLALATPADETDLQDAYQAARGALDGAGLLRLPPRGSPDLQAAVEAEHGKARALAAALDGDTSGADEAVQAALADREAGAVRAVRAALTAGDPDAIARARRLAPAVRELRDNIATGPMRAVPVAKVAGKRPDRLLSLMGRNGALLSIGGVLVLAGEGGIAKSPLALSIAAGMAGAFPGEYGDLRNGLFEGRGGAALIVGYEDDPTVTADRLRALTAAKDWHGEAAEVSGGILGRVHVLAMHGRPLFGPAPGDLYNARPGSLPAWPDVWREAERIEARLVVIDPALSAYVGDANAAAPVRDFIEALAERAASIGAGVLLVAHSTKEARKVAASNYDPLDPGNVSGSSHWTDAARGVLTLTFDKRKDAAPGDRVLAVSKANYGPAHLAVHVDPVVAGGNAERRGEIVGFTNAIGAAWATWPPKTEATAEAASGKANGARKAPANVDTSEA